MMLFHGFQLTLFQCSINKVFFWDMWSKISKPNLCKNKPFSVKAIFSLEKFDNSHENYIFFFKYERLEKNKIIWLHWFFWLTYGLIDPINFIMAVKKEYMYYLFLEHTLQCLQLPLHDKQNLYILQFIMKTSWDQRSTSYLKAIGGSIQPASQA